MEETKNNEAVNKLNQEYHNTFQNKFNLPFSLPKDGIGFKFNYKKNCLNESYAEQLIDSFCGGNYL